MSYSNTHLLLRVRGAGPSVATNVNVLCTCMLQGGIVVMGGVNYRFCVVIIEGIVIYLF